MLHKLWGVGAGTKEPKKKPLGKPLANKILPSDSLGKPKGSLSKAFGNAGLKDDTTVLVIHDFKAKSTALSAVPDDAIYVGIKPRTRDGILGMSHTTNFHTFKRL